MDQLERLRRAHKINSSKALGLDGRYDRVFAGEARGLGEETEIADLPLDDSRKRPLQDPETGELYLMPGISLPGGGDLPGPP